MDSGYVTTLAEWASDPFPATEIPELEKSFMLARRAQLARFVPTPHDSRQVRRRLARDARATRARKPNMVGDPRCSHLQYEVVGEKRSYDRKPLGLLRCAGCGHRRVMNLREWGAYLRWVSKERLAA